jgi:hypothetical protein
VEPFVFKHGTDRWPDGVAVLYVFAVPDLTRDTELAALVHGSQAVVKDLPITPALDEWLHVTIDQVTGAVGRSITQAERDNLAVALREELARVEPLTLTAGSMLSYASGVICDLSPDDGLSDLHHRVRSVINAVCQPEACRYEWGVQHMAIGYAYGKADSDQVQRLLRRVRPSHAPLHIDEVHLVDVAADHQAHQITWKHLARIPLKRRLDTAATGLAENPARRNHLRHALA